MRKDLGSMGTGSSRNPDKDTFFILVTKHSEKTVILEELKAQQRREEFHIQENIHRRDEEDGYIEGIPDDDGLTDPRTVRVSLYTQD